MFNNLKKLFVKNEKENIESKTMSNSRWGGYTNIASGNGTGRAIDSYSGRKPMPYLTYMDIDELYRSNWMAKKLIDIPASDMTRKWRNFTHDDAGVIKKRGLVEKKLNVKDVVRRAIQWADLYGGAVIVLHLDDKKEISKPLDVNKIKKGQLSGIDVVFKDQIVPASQINLNPYSSHFQSPEFYYIASADRQLIHHSRIIPFYGAELPLYSLLKQNSWGDSKLAASHEIILMAEKIWQDISQLISQANIDVLQIKGYMDLMGANRPNLFRGRLNEIENITSNYKKLILDADDKYERKELSGLQGLAEVMFQILQMIAASGNMPTTRFLSSSVGGFSTGDNEITEYYDSMHERQNRIYPQINKLDEIIEMSTFGRKMDIDFEWNSLREMDDAQKSDVDLKKAQRDETYLRMGVIDEAIIGEQLMNEGTYSSIDADWIQKLKDTPEEFGYEEDTQPTTELKEKVAV